MHSNSKSFVNIVSYKAIWSWKSHGSYPCRMGARNEINAISLSKEIYTEYMNNWVWSTFSFNKSYIDLKPVQILIEYLKVTQTKCLFNHLNLAVTKLNEIKT